MIRHFFKITLGVVALMSVFVSCDDSEDAIKGLMVDKEEITVGAEGATEKLFVESGEKWVATTTEPWLMLSPANGEGVCECSVVIDSSLVNDLRTATIRFCCMSGATKNVTVRQTGYGKMIRFEEPEIEIEASAKTDERYFETEVTTNVPFEVKIEYDENDENDEEWLTPGKINVELDRGARPRTTKLRFDWKMNTLPEPRVAKIYLQPTGGNEIETPAVLTLTQKAAIKIEDNREGDSLALLTIFERLNSMADPWDTSENMRNWNNVTLWEANDSGLPAPEAVGRVRSASFLMFRTEESIPQEVRYLKYAESLDFSSNTNTMLLSIELGPEICELDYLKELTLFSYGLITLPEEFVKLGNSLEYLDISANNFNDIPQMLTPEDFPKLKKLRMVASRRWTTSDLRKADQYEDGLGLHINTLSNNSLRRLFLWENLEELSLSNCYIEGEVPDFKVGEEGVVAYTQADVDAFGGDTIQYLADNNCPKILPNMKHLAINLNFFTGNLPDWLLYHPYLLMWYPDLLVFNQQESGRNTDGELVRFDNVPSSFDYYYSVFPGTREKYEFKEEITE